MAEALATRPLTPDLLQDFETVLGRSGVSGCWCMYWLTDGTGFRQGAKGGAKAANRATFARIVAAGAPGLLAYDGADPVGWVRVMPRAAMPGLAASRLWRTERETDGVWSLSCFRVRAGWRGRGLMRTLTRAAIGFARARGATALEAYPRETGDRLSPAAAYLGRASTFRALGFEEVQRNAPDRPMMRLAL